MKTLLHISYAISTIILTVLLAGCATTANVTIDHISTKNTLFIVGDEKDNIGVGSVISEELIKRGYKIYATHRQQKNQSNQQSKPIASFGSGFFITKDGVMISNAHVVKDANSIVVRKTDGKKFMAKVVIADENNDIAVLRPVEPVAVSEWLTLGRFKDTKLGDRLMIVGFPLSNILGNHPRVTEGIVSSEFGIFDDPTRFQVSAPIQPGNSGGPILDEEFRVIGIATEKLSDRYVIEKTGSIPQNVNFGVKIDYSKMLLNEDIEKSIDADTPAIKTLGDAIKATVLVAVNVSNIPESIQSPEPRRTILITYNYQYYWDVFHYTLSSFNMQWVDDRTGEIVATGNFSGDSLLSYVSIVKGVLKEVFTKAGM